MTQILEIRSYNLKPATRLEFLKRMSEEAIPMLQRWGVDVVACGPSLHDENSCYLLRAYENLEHREKSQDAFYGSDEWRLGPREAILSLIESYTTVVTEVSDTTVANLSTSLKEKA
jgi:NIPSNAP